MLKCLEGVLSGFFFSTFVSLYILNLLPEVLIYRHTPMGGVGTSHL